MRWEKLGHVYAPRGERAWAGAHAFLPTSLMLGDERIRVYSAVRDRANVGRVGFVEVDARDPTKVLRVSERPALDAGGPGTFDDSGVSPVSLVEHGGRLLLYYIGWQLGVKVRYTLLMGLAESVDGGETFRRVSRVPVLERSDTELFVRSAGFVLRDGGRWRMWYVAGDRWVEVGENCFLGVNATVANNLKIGRDCWLAPNTVVFKDLPPETFLKPPKCEAGSASTLDFFKVRE